MPSFDLGRYLDRLGWTQGTAPTLATLNGLLRAHMAAIPFENLDVLLGRPVRLDLDSIQAKLVGARRGGYCFEHAALFAAAIESLGFRPARHMARVVLFSARTESPRAHMVLTVELPEGRFVLDPGFGGPAPTFAVPLGHTAPDGPATHVMAQEGQEWVLRTFAEGAASDAWVTTLEHEHPVDYEMSNHFIAKHPASPFVNHIMMSRFTATGRVSIMDRDVTILDGATRETLQLADREALRAIVDRHFGFDLPEIEGLRVPAIPDWA